MWRDPKNSSVDQDLRKIENREWQLWYLTLSLLIIIVGITVSTYFTFLGEAYSGSQDKLSIFYRVLVGLSILTLLFCLYILHTRLTIRRMMALLTEISSLAAASLDLDRFLSSFAHKIAKTTSVTLCQIALLTQSGFILKLRSAQAIREVEWQPQVGKVYPLQELPTCMRALNNLRPVVLYEKDLEQIQDEVELLTGKSRNIHSILILPMVSRDRAVGIIILGEVKGFKKSLFTSMQVTMAQALAKHIADAIDRVNLEEHAFRDPLTNLYNRRYFDEHMAQEISRADRNGHPLAILLCDLDRFKAINDSQGHQVGDEVLKAVAQGIQETARGTDLVFRWGGDEIVIILSKVTRDGALIAAERIRKCICKISEQTHFDLDISIGIALYPEHDRNINELIRLADRALYIAKKGRGKIHIGEEEYRLDEQSIKVVFQSVVDIRSNEVLGYEALSRDPQGKLGILEIFKRYEAIGQLNELKRLCFSLQLKAAEKAGIKRVFLNVDFGLLSEIQPLSKPPGMEVVLEISEREALHGIENHLRVAKEWRSQGFKFAMDDFGAGFISLAFLARLIPEHIKVDRSIILLAVSSKQFGKFSQDLLAALRNYVGEGIIAEGIETETELQVVKEMGVYLVQGFLVGKPLEFR